MKHRFWDGKGVMPPVGIVCEVYHYNAWRECEIIAHRGALVIYYVPDCIEHCTGSTSGPWFRPSEREAVVEAAQEIINSYPEEAIETFEQVLTVLYNVGMLCGKKT